MEPGGFRWQLEEGNDMQVPEWGKNRPSTTIPRGSNVVAGPGRSEFVKGGVSRQDRPGSVKVTPEEAAALQSYPANFDWRGSKTKRYLQIGNAVPPLLAQRVLEALWAEPAAELKMAA